VSNLAEGVKLLGSSWLGDTFMTRAGTLRIFDASYTSATAADYTTVHALITDEDGATSSATVINASARGLTGTRTERIVNDVRINYTGGSSDDSTGAYFFDLPSQLLYGVRSKTFSSQSGYLTPSMAQAYLAAHKSPPIEVGEVELRPWGNQALTDWCLDTLELERRITYREATPFGAAVVNADFRIIGEKWAWANGTDWTVTLRLAPV